MNEKLIKIYRIFFYSLATLAVIGSVISSVFAKNVFYTLGTIVLAIVLIAMIEFILFPFVFGTKFTKNFKKFLGLFLAFGIILSIIVFLIVGITSKKFELIYLGLPLLALSLAVVYKVWIR
ncbi:conserved hypothetical protein [Caldicellulosiruptor hydrothermalis 108]|uniref:Uncharacterized protein n=1 Tax=Caldicellulosiruptor hydrothermalis (strain DSM 18901 / VKM B-2411 / 108) TaxID=632292 RepID=E4Q7E7_CALH1|nr:hypothetical protein [Caldicellulosiruptor hydrothermalis]ADQ07792.1 conserved hypothetical protein [Caldicellulosiruptor hydrothermalis 108]